MNKTINLFRKFFQEIGVGKGFEIERTATIRRENIEQKQAKAQRI
jgi:hypothetical protein